MNPFNEQDNEGVRMLDNTLLQKPRYPQLPIVLSMGHLWFTVLLAALDMTAPVNPGFPFSMQVPLRLFGFITAAYVLFAVGYFSGARVFSRKCPSRGFLPQSMTALRFLVVAGSCHMCLGALARLLAGGYELTPGLIGQLAPGETYRSLHAFGTTNEPSLVFQILNLTYVLLLCAMPLGALLWSRLGFLLKVLFITGLSAHVLGFFACGTNQGVAEVLVYVTAGRMAAICGNWGGGGRRPGTRRLLVKLILIGAGLGISFVFSYGYIMGDRHSPGEVAVFDDTPIGRVVGAPAAFTLHMLAHYASQGYCGLSYLFIEPLPRGGWTWGAGNSSAAMDYVDKYLSIDLWPYHYAHLVETRYGYPTQTFWITAFPWIASDVSFPGCLIFMFLAGRFLARCWWEATVECRLSSAIMLAQLALFVVYLPANNQVVQGNGNFIGFVCLATWWAYDHIKPAIRERAPTAWKG